MAAQNAIDRLDQLIAKGESVLRTHRPNPPNVFGFPTLDSGAFTEWRTQSLACLVSLLGDGHVYVENFKEQIKQGFFGTVRAGIGILKATKEDIAAGNLDRDTARAEPIAVDRANRFAIPPGSPPVAIPSRREINTGRPRRVRRPGFDARSALPALR